MSCDMDRRIYDEDNDTGYTVTMKEALRYSQVQKRFLHCISFLISLHLCLSGLQGGRLAE